MNRLQRRIVIIGASGHGLAVHDAARSAGFDVVGFLDSFKPIGTPIAGLSILGHPDDLSSLAHAHAIEGYFLAISDNWTRSEVAAKLKCASPELLYVSVVHRRSVVADGVAVGNGVLVLAGAIVNSSSTLSDGCIVNTNASLDHESNLEPFASILPGVTTGGNVSIGLCSCVCAGSTVVHGVAVGEHTVIGAGSLVLRDVPARVLAYGSPLRVVRERSIGERHF